jgi:uncharacterized protein
MNHVQSGIYFGRVTHKRLRPVQHELNYDVASLLVDVDELATGHMPTLLSHNRFNLFSIHDRDHGDLGAGLSISAFAWGKVAQAGLGGVVAQIFMLCYPRILGYAFNPLTTYYALDSEGEIRLMIYEVHNTFGGRHVYTSEPMVAGATAFHTTEKVFRVSPFNGVEGRYALRASRLGDNISTDDGPLLKAYFHGRRSSLTAAGLVGVFVRLPFQSLKVIGGIHWEALKLWLKGLNLHLPK